MRFSLAILAVAAASASASLVQRQLPNCALPCLSGPNVNFDGCAPSDNACLCKSKVFVGNSTACITKACQGADLQSALTLAQQLCAAVGVTLTSTPSAATQTSGAASGTAAATSTAPSGSSASSSSTATSSAAAATKTNSARSNTAGALAGMAAFGLAALAL